ncbi:MAG TPA: hypothetical protein VGU69_18335 [Rhizomicrobium sp.]|nr:hypothetical protein [Rhizomicrobium sp.]
MVAVDNVADRVSIPGHPAWIAGTSLVVAFLLVIGSFVWKGLTDHGLLLAGDLTSRFALLLFVSILIVQPLDRRLSFGFLHGLGRERAALTLGFAGVMTISLACLSAPMAMTSATHAFASILYSVFTAGILFVLVVGTVRGRSRSQEGGIARAMQTVAMTYFWLSFAFAAFVRLNGDEHTDVWAEISLGLLLLAVLLLGIDTWLAKKVRKA